MVLRTVLFTAFLVLLATSSAPAQQDAEVRDLAQNPAGHYGKVITVEGTIAGYQTRVTARGTPYASFRLKEGDASVMVFAGRPKGLRNNLHVRVTGKFTKLKRVGRDTFRNAVEAYRVVVLR